MLMTHFALPAFQDEIVGMTEFHRENDIMNYYRINEIL
jgi:hypothetical protein